MKLYHITEAKGHRVPIILSSPHSGTAFPDDIARQLNPEYVATPDDTDWFIDQLYDFAPDLGITMISAHYSRWVIDLNRAPDSKPLYTDGRVITGLATTTTFNGDPLYKDITPDQKEVDRRVEAYYKPYHQKISDLLQETKAQFGTALLFDAHSIRRLVPGIRPEPFPELILGDADGQSAAPKLIEATMKVLGKGSYELSHNHPFKGGYITRSFGDPEHNIHALQLEMAKTNYMDDAELNYHPERAEKLRGLLKELFLTLIDTLK